MSQSTTPEIPNWEQMYHEEVAERQLYQLLIQEYEKEQEWHRLDINQLPDKAVLAIIDGYQTHVWFGRDNTENRLILSEVGSKKWFYAKPLTTTSIYWRHFPAFEQPDDNPVNS